MKTIFFSLHLVALASFVTLGLCATSSLRAQVLLNGSFEDPAQVANSLTNGGGTDWTPSSASTAIVSNDYGSLGNTPYGSQYLGLGPGIGDAQAITGFGAGETYILSLDFADAISQSNPTLTITLSGVVNLSESFTAPVGGPYGAGTIPFTSASLLFTPATAGTVTVTITDTSTNTSIPVDNVALLDNVPEPSAWAMLLGGAGALGPMLRRRRLRVKG